MEGLTGVNDEGSDGRAKDEGETERAVRKRLGEPKRYQPYVPERWESEGGDGDEAERVAGSLLVRGWCKQLYCGFSSINEYLFMSCVSFEGTRHS